jgi:hypothetical protein
MALVTQLMSIPLVHEEKSNWLVIPAEAGIQSILFFKATIGLDPGLRRDDGICLNVE